MNKDCDKIPKFIAMAKMGVISKVSGSTWYPVLNLVRMLNSVHDKFCIDMHHLTLWKVL